MGKKIPRHRRGEIAKMLLHHAALHCHQLEATPYTYIENDTLPVDPVKANGGPLPGRDIHVR